MAVFQPYQMASGGEMLRSGMDLMQMQAAKRRQEWLDRIAKWQMDNQQRNQRASVIGGLIGLGLGWGLSGAGGMLGGAAKSQIMGQQLGRSGVGLMGLQLGRAVGGGIFGR